LAFLSATSHKHIIPATHVLSIPYWVQMLVNVCPCFNCLHVHLHVTLQSTD
jgi:hypothetical protein